MKYLDGRFNNPEPLPGEEWVEEPLDSLYLWSNYGRVWRRKTLSKCKVEGLIPHNVGKKGYHFINFSGRVFDIGTRVLELFFGPRPVGYECCHINDDKDNNHISNLKWASHAENMRDASKNGKLKWTDEARAQQSVKAVERCKVHPHPWKGKTRDLTDEERREMSERTKRYLANNPHPCTGKKWSEESRRKASESRERMLKENGHPNKGKQISEEQKLKISEGLKRYYSLNPGASGKVSKKMSGNCNSLGNKISESHKDSIRESNTRRSGIPISESHKKRISKSLSGENNPMHGKTHSKETRNRMSQARLKNPIKSTRNQHIEESGTPSP